MFRPDVIISTGAFMAIPIFIYGKLFGSKLIYIEITARVYSKSQTGKFLEPICDKFIVQWPEMKTVYKSAEYWGTLI
jgi:beta-1,4-N-acetylglucosaminyltransferase